MQIVFRFKGSEELVVSNQIGGVLLERVNVVRDLPGPNQEAPPKPFDRETCEFLVPLSKGEARSIASALMQAAAEA